MNDRIILRNNDFNILTEDSLKNGVWIEYEIKLDLIKLITLGSGYDNESGMRVHWHDSYTDIYRHLSDSVINGMEVVIKDNVDTINGSIYHSRKIHQLFNRIPPDSYYLISKGNYLNGIKRGKWNYYYRSGLLKKTINYKNGIPQKGYNVYREDGTLYVKVEKLNELDWEISKYSKKGVKLETIKAKIEDFELLY